MKKNILTKLMLIVLIYTFCFNAINAQGMLREVAFEKQIEKSTLIVEGKVVTQKSVWGDTFDNIYTVNTVKVYKVFKGSPVSTIDIITKGGKIDGMEQVVFPNLKLQNNVVGVFTLIDNNSVTNKIKSLKSSNKRYSVYSSLQGFYKYDTGHEAIVNPFVKRKGTTKSFYDEIIRYTKQQYVEVATLEVETKTAKTNLNSKVFLPPTEINFTPTSVTAGTQTQIVISGSDFGSVPGKVGFRDADSGGIDFDQGSTEPLYRDALDSQIVSWSPTQITVIVPTYAGTGDIRVTHDDGTIGISSGILTVDYSLINSVDGLGTQHYSSNGLGDITWTMNTNFDANAPAKAAFLRAFEKWRCETKINWVLANGTTTVNTSNINDGINIISFDTASNPLPEGTLGECTYGIAQCTPRTARDLVTSIDIVFDDIEDNPNTGLVEEWFFGEDTNIGFSQWDFESVAVHELGHAHQLGHVINTNAIMHYAISNFEIQRDLTATDIAAAIIVQSFGTSSSLCGATQMTDYNGGCFLSLDEEELDNNVNIYPNPAQNEFVIKNASNLTLNKATLFDLSGRNIVEYNISQGAKLKTINLSGITSGVYFVKITSDEASVTRKLVIE